MNKGCPKCGRMVDSINMVCPYCNFDFREIENVYKEVQRENNDGEKNAGLIKRLVSGMIDIYIVLLLVVPLFLLINHELTSDNTIFLIISLVVVYILYNSLLERTKMHGSLGKRMMGIEVVDEYENPVTFFKALVRNVSKVFNIITFGIGFLICASSGQTLGDKLSSTFVLNRVSFKEERQFNTSSPYKRLFAFIIDIFYVLIIIFIFNYLVSLVELPEFAKTLPNYAVILIVIVYFPYLESKNGKTRGKKMLKMSVVNYDEDKLSFISYLLRFLFISIDIMTFGFLLPLVNKNGQTLKDMIFKTVVIDV